MNESRPWWLWPNLLALDAPAVAVTWQVFLASAAGVAVPLAASAVLGLVVWAAYLVDRCLDAGRGTDGADRHRVAGRNMATWVVGAVAALVAATALALTALPQAHLTAGFIVLTATIGYFAAVHLVRAKKLLPRGSKEASVGAVFAAGVVIPLVAESPSVANWGAGAVAFGGLCWLNCALISRWEDGAERGHPAWLAVVAGVLAVGAALGAPVAVAGAVLASTAALGVLHVLHGFSVRAARVLADVVLLSPLVAAVWL